MSHFCWGNDPIWYVFQLGGSTWTNGRNAEKKAMIRLVVPSCNPWVSSLNSRFCASYLHKITHAPRLVDFERHDLGLSFENQCPNIFGSTWFNKQNGLTSQAAFKQGLTEKQSSMVMTSTGTLPRIVLSERKKEFARSCYETLGIQWPSKNPKIISHISF